MLLAEALQNRADLQRRIAQLNGRIEGCVLVQEGETPPEDPKALIREAEECFEQLEALIARINRTNCAVETAEGTLTELIARRDCMIKRTEMYRRFLEEARSATRRATRTEIKILPAVSVAEYQAQCDKYAREARRVDTLIQAANWSTELQ